MKKNTILITFFSCCFALSLFSATTIEARHCRSRFAFNVNVIPQAPVVQPVAYYPAPVYAPIPLYYAPVPYVIASTHSLLPTTESLLPRAASFVFFWMALDFYSLSIVLSLFLIPLLQGKPC